MASLRNKSLWYRLFFVEHKDGHIELDLGYVFLIPFLALAITGFILASMQIWAITSVMWTFLGSLIFSLLICAVPVARARILAQSKAGEVASGIASAHVEDSSTDIQEIKSKQNNIIERG